MEKLTTYNDIKEFPIPGSINVDKYAYNGLVNKINELIDENKRLRDAILFLADRIESGSYQNTISITEQHLTKPL